MRSNHSTARFTHNLTASIAAQITKLNPPKMDFTLLLKGFFMIVKQNTAQSNLSNQPTKQTNQPQKT